MPEFIEIDDLLITPLYEDVIVPSRRDEDGWYDLYAHFEGDVCTILPGKIKKIQTGIISAFDKRRRVKFGERGSNTKSGLQVIAGHIDSGFRGEWIVCLLNSSHVPVYISKKIKEYEITEQSIVVPYSKAICQFGVEIVPPTNIRVVPKETIMGLASERMEGGFGDSGK